MDRLDWKILQILDWSGREPITQIAKKVKSNKDVVAYRIKRLEEQGIVKRYFPVLNMHKLGYHTTRLYLDIEEMNSKEEQDLVTFLDKEIGAGLIFRMDYPYRYGILLWVKSIYDVESALIKIKQKLGRNLVKYHHTVFCKFSVYPKDYLFGKDYHTNSFDQKPDDEINHDVSDFLILKQLSENARLSTTQIAKELTIPQTTVSAKIKNMEKKGIIIGYRAEIDYLKLGYMNYFLEIYLDDNHNLSEIEGWANTNKNVVWLQRIIGTCDIEVEVEVKDRIELENLLDKLRTRFKNIRKIVFWSQEYKKLTFLP
ncbi:Lrp/AsnC family transcriptional regulator [Candidatus Woesearchaeota archaeon]|jgi:Lrp/AsnC family transcriptional regulator, leucine-responsive regulatory protein|nr:Lrp/AsnC family transcriptional regulator [Candidatus Woesearchaeota archaeon]MBT3537904.1 Lrp/AsnC family transcriptional regulator [Candidatus Woesearchaeota archaeon]MBT4698042.1 Lrp/AsnC family transcriptional regulator [Candidatus Woesearchaeota archaeon]MBT4716957.1 Lrp/AsnC family transcriptional regulator [Candidatus Woesearchaeota archaeon]MBT7105573.1 Lrp/AsnC family transcriptional regulator [Candidatus Woesearchaeota archaeon]